jgi:formylglycine-generating enzyme required for sulfatase activity
MHGNVGEWMLDRYLFGNQRAYLRAGDDIEDRVLIENPVAMMDEPRVVRGGGASVFASYQRSANRSHANAVTGVSAFVGFRIARTVKLPSGE